jgi:hypothetical protein
MDQTQPGDLDEIIQVLTAGPVPASQSVRDGQVQLDCEVTTLLPFGL